MEKRQEIIRYTFWGIMSAVLNVGLFQGLVMFGADYRISNVVTLIVVRVFCYVTNKWFVFKTPYEGLMPFLKEMISFVIARGFTFLLDFVGLMLLVEVLQMNKFVGKCFMAVVVVIVNYVLSKKFVFRRGKDPQSLPKTEEAAAGRSPMPERETEKENK